MKIVIDDHLIPLAGKHTTASVTALRPILWLGALYLVLSGVSLFFSYLQNNLIQRAGQGIVSKLRNDLFRHIARLSPSYFDRTSSGSLVTYVSSDTETVSDFFTQVCLSLMRDGMTLVLILVFMFQLDARLAALQHDFAPDHRHHRVLVSTLYAQDIPVSRSRLSHLVAYTAENLSGMNIVQAFHQEKEQESNSSEKTAPTTVPTCAKSGRLSCSTARSICWAICL